MFNVEDNLGFGPIFTKMFPFWNIIGIYNIEIIRFQPFFSNINKRPMFRRKTLIVLVIFRNYFS